MSPDQITIGDVTISPQNVSTANDSYPTTHIQSVHVVENPIQWSTVLLISGLFVMACGGVYVNRVTPISCYLIFGYLGWLLLRSTFAPTKTFAVAIQTGGRKKILAKFASPESKPEGVAAARSKAEELSAAIKRVV
jgi:hypothetical protein